MNKIIEPRIVTLSHKKLIGMRQRMSVAQNLTPELWRSFMPRRKELTHTLSPDFFSLQVYPPGYFSAFNPNAEFEKWALAEVGGFQQIPEGMESFTLPGGLYAVFEYKGSSADPRIFQYIYSNWVPQSEYSLDDRPHFEVLGPNYKNNHPSSEEEIWIPIITKK